MTTGTGSQIGESVHESILQDPVTSDATLKGRKIGRAKKNVTSEKKIESNRRNSLKSRGPQTRGGKKRSSFNALKFGLYAQSQVLPGESHEEYRALLLSLTKELKPQGPIEEMYFTLVEGDMRRLKRLDVAFHAFITDQVLELAARMGDGNSEGLRMLALRKVLATMANQPFDGIEDKLNRLRKQIIGDDQRKLEGFTRVPTQSRDRGGIPIVGTSHPSAPGPASLNGAHKRRHRLRCRQ